MGPRGMFGLLAAVCLLTTVLSGCSGTPGEPTAANPEPPDSVAVTLVHPPYDTGAGRLRGTFLRSEVATYPAGSLQRLVPFDAVIVRWEVDGTTHDSEFLINGAADLSLNGKRERRVPTERVVQALADAGEGSTIEIAYSGSDLTPVAPFEPKEDYEYALVGEITITDSK